MARTLISRTARFIALGLIALTLVPLAVRPARAQTGGGAAVDQALSVVLRSGCADGVATLTAVAQSAELSAEERAVALRIVALCQKVVSDRLQSGGIAGGEVDRSGRGKLVFGGTLYGIWTGIALDIIADIDDGRAMVVPPLLGGAAGLTLSLLATRQGEITNAQAWSNITGFDYGTYSGLIWGAAADDDEKVIAGSALGTGLAGGIAAIMLTRGRHPRQGDIELVRSGGLWGFATGGLIAALVQPDQSRTTFTLMGLGMDGGLAVGLALSQVLDIPRNRMLFIDTGALGGGLLGFAAAFLVIGSPDGDRDGRILAGSALAGLYAGMAAAAYLTRDMQPDRQDVATTPALLARTPAGRWGMGRLAILPVLTPHGAGTRLTGALAPLVGGAW
jgi:hypothetical protein